MGFQGGKYVDRLRVVASFVVAAAAVGLLVHPLDLPVRDTLTAAGVFFFCIWLTARPMPQATFLPLARTLLPGVGPILAGAIVASYSAVSIGELSIAALLAVVVLDIAVMACIAHDSWLPGRRRPLRLAVVGSARSAAALAMELRASGAKRYQIVGFIFPDDQVTHDADAVVPHLGQQSSLATIVATNQIDLLLVSAEVPRLPLFEEIAATCLNLPVRVMELAVFYEETFGHVALAAINASWFQYLMHPRYSRATPGLKRAFDLMIAVPTLLLALPVVAVLAALVRIDGGPIFFRQTRIGEGGRPFVILKLRSMRQALDSPRWSSQRDDRVTAVGAFMRRTHLDELPQVINVIRGEMSIVGPRPEQPAMVKNLELAIPFYSRRHLVRPGITGWAQVQCGYAGSDRGSALKACYDLYYVKHRSVRLDCLIVLETLRSLFADRQWPEHSAHRLFAYAEEHDEFEEASPHHLPRPVGQEVGSVALKTSA